MIHFFKVKNVLPLLVVMFYFGVLIYLFWTLRINFTSKIVVKYNIT